MANPKLVQQMVDTAEFHQMPYVQTVSLRIMTEVSKLQYIGEGVRGGG